MTTFVYAYSARNNFLSLVWRSELTRRKDVIAEMVEAGITDAEAGLDDFLFFEKREEEKAKAGWKRLLDFGRWDFAALVFGMGIGATIFIF